MSTADAQTLEGGDAEDQLEDTIFTKETVQTGRGDLTRDKQVNKRDHKHYKKMVLVEPVRSSTVLHPGVLQGL